MAVGTSQEQGRVAAARAWLERRDREQRQAREARRLEVLAAARGAILRIAPRHPSIRSVALFGSVLEPGRFRDGSDIDIAVDCDEPDAESRFWRELEDALDRPVDLRPRTGAVSVAVARTGESVYAREAPAS